METLRQNVEKKLFNGDDSSTGSAQPSFVMCDKRMGYLRPWFEPCWQVYSCLTQLLFNFVFSFGAAQPQHHRHAGFERSGDLSRQVFRWARRKFECSPERNWSRDGRCIVGNQREYKKRRGRVGDNATGTPVFGSTSV